jgi:release factor glutamine methyltransferase
MTILEALQWANHKLKRHRDMDEETGAALDSPMLDAEVLLSAVLNVQKSWLFAHFDHPLRDHEIEKLQRMVERRVTHEPIAYVTGEKEFYKRIFHVNRFVLIPRPATETLVGEAIKIARDDHGGETNLLFADIGTGSGAIAVTLAVETRIPVIAIDTNREALAIARRNATEHHVDDLVDVRHGDLLEPLVKIFKKLETERKQTSSVSHLLLAANLPYLTTTQWESAQPEVKNFEPREALEAGVDGLNAYWNLFRQLKRARALLPARITVLIEIDPAQRNRAIALIKHDFPEREPRVVQDLEGLDRVVTVAC